MVLTLCILSGILIIGGLLDVWHFSIFGNIHKEAVNLPNKVFNKIDGQLSNKVILFFSVRKDENTVWWISINF